MAYPLTALSVLWELFTRQTPHAKLAAKEVGLKVLQEGLRPAIPHNCPAPYSQLMQQCWDEDPTVRPTFEEILTRLGHLARHIK